MWSSPKHFGESWSIWMGYLVIHTSTRVSLLEAAGWTICFLRTNWYCMRGSSQQGLQHAFDRFSAACDQTGKKISAEKLRDCVSQDAQGSVFCTWAKMHCSKWSRSSTLQQMESFKYLGVVFTSNGSRNKGIDTRISEANAVLRKGRSNQYA